VRGENREIGRDGVESVSRVERVETRKVPSRNALGIRFYYLIYPLVSDVKRHIEGVHYW